MKKNIQNFLQALLLPDVMAQKKQKQLVTSQYLNSHRNLHQPSVPVGFKSRAKASYFFSNY